MPPKPFPFPIGIGIDICHIPRIQNLITKDGGKWLTRFTKRIFNDYEHRVFQRKIAASTKLRDSNLLAQWLAGRFAAKEAAFKAVSTRRLGWHDITICEDSSYKPYAVIHARHIMPSLPESRSPPKSGHLERSVGSDALGGKDRLGEVNTGRELEGQVAELSISHDGAYATAIVLALNEGSGGQEGLG